MPDHVVIAANNYGKSRVRMMKVSRSGKTQSLRELNVAIALEGDFDRVHTHGDNSPVLPTDTMKNTVYALGKGHPIDTIESFALHLADHFLAAAPHISSARIHISETPWNRLTVDGAPHPHAFSKGSEERQTCEIHRTRTTLTMTGGIEGLILLKTTDSAFDGFMRDKFTTLKEVRDRIFATSITATWNYTAAASAPALAQPRHDIRNSIINAFAHHKSESVQHTLYEMGRAALAASNQISRISLSLPNKHCLLIDLSPFGMTNPNEIFVPTDEPHGLIEATIARA